MFLIETKILDLLMRSYENRLRKGQESTEFIWKMVLKRLLKNLKNASILLTLIKIPWGWFLCLIFSAYFLVVTYNADDPSKDPNVTGDPYKTLFVAGLNYETTEHMIEREFETYGPIKRVHLITDRETKNPRGYAFIEYVHTRDMKSAYKQADRRKLDGKRVLVDVERGRTVANWHPRRLGGGLGSTRVGGQDVSQKYFGREQQVVSGGSRRSEEPTGRDDRHVDREREKSRDRGREREQDQGKSRERSHDRLRDRDSREDRHHHRDRDRHRERERETDRGCERDRVRDRDWDHGRGCDRERPRERERERDKDYDRGSYDIDHSRAREREMVYDHIEPKHNEEQPDERERDYEYEADHGHEWYDKPVDHGHGELKPREHEDGGREAYDQMESDVYHRKYYDACSEPEEKETAHDREYDYECSERALSREYDQ